MDVVIWLDCNVHYEQKIYDYRCPSHRKNICYIFRKFFLRGGGVGGVGDITFYYIKKSSITVVIYITITV